MLPRLVVSFVLGLSGALSAPGASSAVESCYGADLKGEAAVRSDWSDDGPGVCRRILPGDLVAPSASNRSHSRIVPIPAGALPDVPRGFRAYRFYRGTAKPRLIGTAPNGDIFVAESDAGRIRALRPAALCQLGRTSLFASGLNRPFGIAFYPPGPNPQWVYVAETGRVVRFPYRNDDLKARGGLQVVVPNLPAGAGSLPGNGHWTRDIVFRRDGRRMFVSIGSYSNVQESRSVDETGRAMIVSYDLDGSDRHVVATGLRNPVSISRSPHNGAIWTTVNERDELGDNLVPDFVTPIAEGQFFGWPWYYIGNNVDRRPAVDPPGNLPPITVPRVLLQAHSAPLGSVFYTGTQFPAPYRGDMFVALHGSWNRDRPTGAKVARVIFTSQGGATGQYEDFMTGFTLAKLEAGHEVWGRPVGVAVGTGGSLYVSEDANNAIYCARWVGAD